MNDKDFAKGINKAWLYAKFLGVGELYACPVSLKVSDKFIEVALSSTAIYEDVYLCGLQCADYNILLADYAYFQFSAHADAAMRLAYYPNPFLGASKEAVQDLSSMKELVVEGAIDLEEYLHQVSEIRNSQHPPLVRYENAPGDYKELKHPCSHMHFGHHQQNRWPVKRVLTPQAFALLIMKTFYTPFWEGCGKLKINKSEHSLDELFSKARQDCHPLPNSLFSAAEEKQFHFL